MKQTVLITGATAGIGMSTAKLLADKGYDLILTGRREQKLKQLAQALSKKIKVRYFAFSVADREACKQVVDKLIDEGIAIDILINNAGNAYGLDPAHKGDFSDWDNMIDINIKGLLNMTRFISPLMVERKMGQIINIGSIAGKETYPNGNVYCASKAAVVSFTEALRKDLNPFGIRVAMVNPGLVETEFSNVRFHGNTEKAKTVYKGYRPLTAHDIAETILFMVTRPLHVNVADVLILPTDQASSTIVNKKKL